MIFLDAAGLSNPKHEPYVVVAGVILHGDRQWKALGDHLTAMADEYAPPAHRQNFVFHATELFSGGKVFPRDKYPKEWRWKVLDQLLAIPKQFDLPIVWGRMARLDVNPGGQFASDHKAITPVIQAQMLCFITAMVSAEHWMVKMTDPTEIAAAIMENDDQSREFVRFVHRAITDPRKQVHSYPEFNLTRIIHPIHFEEKVESSALQVADACAFALKRIVMGSAECERFVPALHGQLVNHLKKDVLSLEPSTLSS